MKRTTFFLSVWAVMMSICGTAQATTTSSGFDTVSGNQVFAVEGSKVGEWSPTQLSVTGGLAATGAVQIGQSTDTCSPSIEGAQRYNKTTKAMEYCNGSSWGGFGDRKGSMCGLFEAWCSMSGTYYQPSYTAGYYDEVCPITAPPFVVQDCDGASTTVASAIYNGYGGNYKVINACPSGYTMRRLSRTLVSTTTGNKSAPADIYYNALSCVKN